MFEMMWAKNISTKEVIVVAIIAQQKERLKLQTPSESINMEILVQQTNYSSYLLW